MTDQIAMQMPRYKCHKEVWALKIADIIIFDDGRASILAMDPGYARFEVPDYKAKYHGTLDDKGYYVMYADGYASWSPSKAFEEGYTLVP